MRNASDDECNYQLIVAAVMCVALAGCSAQTPLRVVLREGTDLSLREALAHESEIMDTVSASEDCIEGVMSFIEKREPSWKDR